MELSVALADATCTEKVLQSDPCLLLFPPACTRTLAFRSVLAERQLDSHAGPALKALFRFDGALVRLKVSTATLTSTPANGVMRCAASLKKIIHQDVPAIPTK